MRSRDADGDVLKVRIHNRRRSIYAKGCTTNQGHKKTEQNDSSIFVEKLVQTL